MTNVQRSDVPGFAVDYRANMAELERRFADRKKKHHLCPNKLCRWVRRCIGEGTPCNQNPMPSPISNNDAKRVDREFKRARRSRQRW